MENHISIEEVGKGAFKKKMFTRVTTYDAAIVRDAATGMNMARRIRSLFMFTSLKGAEAPTVTP